MYFNFTIAIKGKVSICQEDRVLVWHPKTLFSLWSPRVRACLCTLPSYVKSHTFDRF